jgi:hypothetical protein
MKLQCMLSIKYVISRIGIETCEGSLLDPVSKYRAVDLSSRLWIYVHNGIFITYNSSLFLHFCHIMYILSSSIVLSSDFTYMLQFIQTVGQYLVEPWALYVVEERPAAVLEAILRPPRYCIAPCNNNNTQTSKLKSQVWPPRSVPPPLPPPPTWPTPAPLPGHSFLSVFNFLSTISRFVVQTRYLRKQLVPFLVYLTIRT